MKNYLDKLKDSVQDSDSLLCVGLDPDLAKIGKYYSQNMRTKEDWVLEYCKIIIDQTAEFACAFKPNLAFFEALGLKGFEVFAQVVEYIPKDKICIADAKRGDIGNTASHYAKAFFEELQVDALTINPLMGHDTLKPYFNYPSKAIYVLTLTSNDGADDYLNRFLDTKQTLSVQISNDIQALQSESHTHLGMVIGATKSSSQMKNVLGDSNSQSLLIPGIGAQGGSISTLIDGLSNYSGIPIINSTRSIMYPSDSDDFKIAIKLAAQKTKDSLTPLFESVFG